MASEKQIEANRNNSKLSTGPKTESGKAKVRMNALKHGLRTEGFQLLPTEKPEEFAARLDGWNRVYRPVNQVEADLVYQAVALSWLVDRALYYEGSFLSERILETIETCEREGKDLESTIRAADLAAYDSSPEGEKRRRYQFALRRDLMRTLAELSRLRGRTPSPDLGGKPGANEAVLEMVRQEWQPPRMHEAEPDVAGRGPAEPADRRPADVGAASRPLGPFAPNKANSPATSTVDFEEILRKTRTSERPNKANSPRARLVASGIGSKRSSNLSTVLGPVGAAGCSWLDVSCLKS